MIKAVIFDLDNVFTNSPKFSDIFCEKYDLGVEDFLSAFKQVLAETRKPNAKEFYALIKPYLDDRHLYISRDEFYDFWFSSETEDSNVVEIAKTLKNKGLKVYILSNNFKERAEYYDKHLECVRLFKTYYSCQTGYVKPDKHAYKNILEKEGLEPEEVIYFDDQIQNIDVAKSLGIKGYLYDKYTDIPKILAKFL